MAQYLSNIRWRHIVLGAILAAALLLRIAYLAEYRSAPDFNSPILDPQLNDYWARALLSGDWTPPPHADNPEIQTTPYGRPPAYPWLLAAMYWCSRGSYMAPRLVQFLVGLINIVLVYLLAKHLSGTRAGLFAAFLMAIFWGAPYFEGELNSPVWEVFLFLSCLLCLLRWLRKDSIPALAAAGISLGIGALMRPNVLLVGGFFLFWIALQTYLRKQGVFKVLLAVLIFGVSLAAAVTPVILRNYAVSRQFVLISYYGGINAYIGNNPLAEGTAPDVPDLYEISGVEKWNCFNYPSIVRGLAVRQNKPELGFAGASRYFYQRALTFWKNEPLQALKLTLRKAWLFWGPHEISDSKVVFYERLHSNILSRLPRFSHLLMLVLAGITVAVLLRKSSVNLDRQTASLAACACAGYFLSVLPFFISERYRFPILPVLLPFAGYYGEVFLEMVTTKRFGKTLVCVAVLAAWHPIVFFPVVNYAPDHSVWHLHRGIAGAARGNTRLAFENLQNAIAENPLNDEAHLQLGYLYAQQNNRQAALEHYQKAVDANPNNVFALNNLGYEYYLQGNYAEAERFYRRALARQPIFALALNNLGNAVLRQGAFKEARSLFERVLEHNPEDPFARYNLGNAYLEVGDYDKAIEIYAVAAKEQPNNPNIANNMGLALARSGRLHEAIDWFEKALNLASPYPLAHFNLGNVYGDLGDLEKACYHYGRTLADWPEHGEAKERFEQLCGVGSES